MVSSIVFASAAAAVAAESPPSSPGGGGGGVGPTLGGGGGGGGGLAKEFDDDDDSDDGASPPSKSTATAPSPPAASAALGVSSKANRLPSGSPPPAGSAGPLSPVRAPRRGGGGGGGDAGAAGEGGFGGTFAPPAGVGASPSNRVGATPSSGAPYEGAFVVPPGSVQGPSRDGGGSGSYVERPARGVSDGTFAVPVGTAASGGSGAGRFAGTFVMPPDDGARPSRESPGEVRTRCILAFLCGVASAIRCATLTAGATQRPTIAPAASVRRVTSVVPLPGAGAGAGRGGRAGAGYAI